MTKRETGERKKPWSIFLFSGAIHKFG